MREKEEEMSHKSKNNLLKCLITICVRRYYNLCILTEITKCVGWIYYKMLHPLLHNAHIITKCVTYYKMHRYYKMPRNKRGALGNLSMKLRLVSHLC